MRTKLVLTAKKVIEFEDEDDYEIEKEAIVKELEDNDFEVEILEEEDVVKEEDDDWLEES